MKKPIIQTHHLIYENKEHNQKEVKGKIFKGEHFIISNLNRRTNISKFFIKCLKTWIILNEEKARDLDV